MIDRNTNLSYLGCGTALWVGRQIDSYEGLFYTKREDFEAKVQKSIWKQWLTISILRKRSARCNQ